MVEREPALRGPRRRARATRPRVHGRGEARLDAMLALTEEASRPAPLPSVLARMCREIAGLFAVEVCSIYLRESASGARDSGGRDRRTRGELVLRATFGQPEAAIGAVRMRVGEGLTGFAVECLRPVSVARAAVDARNKAFPGLDEQRFPSLCAIPLVDGGRAVGALVLQRRQPRAFTRREIVLLAAVASPVLFALERARNRAHHQAHDDERLRLEEVSASARPADRPHEILLRGDGASPGRALGTVQVRRHAAARPVRREERELDLAGEHDRLGRALASAAEEIAALESWAAEHAPIDRATMLGLLSPARYVLDDARLRGRMIHHLETGASAEDAVEQVTREYTRLLSASDDPLLAARALEVEALCQRVMAHLAEADGAALPAPVRPGAILCAARLTVAGALELAAGHGVAVALSQSADGSTGVPLALALGLPVISGLSELYRWVADGDRALVDAEAGTLLVNPSRVDVAAFRRR